MRWLHGDASSLPPLQVDLAAMTANVAQVFLTDATGTPGASGVPAGMTVFDGGEAAESPAAERYDRHQTLHRHPSDGRPDH